MQPSQLFRFAPTPSGYLHAGNLFNLVLTQHRVQQLGAELLLRIDDLDAQRQRPEYVDFIFRALDFFEIKWHRGPTSAADFYANWSQHHRSNTYQEALQDLASAELVFACACSRSEIRTAGSEGCTGTCLDKGLSLDTPLTAWRLKDESGLCRQTIVRQKNGAVAYMLASIVDDVAFGVSHIVRGADLQQTTQIQRSIADIIPRLASFRHVEIEHHPLITDEKGEKLSKSTVVAEEAPPDLTEGLRGEIRKRVLDYAAANQTPSQAS